jgi:hypothetical protein
MCHVCHHTPHQLEPQHLQVHPTHNQPLVLCLLLLLLVLSMVLRVPQGLCVLLVLLQWLLLLLRLLWVQYWRACCQQLPSASPAVADVAAAAAAACVPQPRSPPVHVTQ